LFDREAINYSIIVPPPKFRKSCSFTVVKEAGGLGLVE